MDAVRGRHDDALESIKRALLSRSGGQTDQVELCVNQTVRGLAGPGSRPALHLFNHSRKIVAVVYLAMAVEDKQLKMLEALLLRVWLHRSAPTVSSDT
uniref:Uncharacterized protein n=1 Tax=Peronospora matthiolae TaxID=2874970 RepID=A0AAV1TAN8_9STRA